MSDRIQLFLEWPERVGDGSEEMAWMEGADAMVIDPCRCSLAQFERTGVEKAVVRNGKPERDNCWFDHAVWWVQDEGLEEVARRRDEHPTLEWVPRLEVSRAQVSYRFSGPAVGEGFSFYMPDTAAVKGWQINGAGYSMLEAVTRATELGLTTLWLHSPEAEVSGKGLDLDLLDTIRGGPLEIWLSGGAAEPKHLHNLLKAGGATAVVVGEKLTRTATIGALHEAMVPEKSVPEAVPIHFERQPAQEV